MRDFLKPEWKKFILPIILIILFFVVINAFYTSGSVMDKYGCEAVSLIQEQQANIKQNNTLAINQTVSRMRFLSQNIQNDMRQIQNIEPIFNFVKTIDPFIPVPCEAMQGNVCEFYINKDTYNCFINLKSEKTTGINILAEPEINEYRVVSLPYLGLNVLLVFIEGYLISLIILFVYQKIKKK